MPNENGGIGDSVSAVLNATGEEPALGPDAKGPDEAVWGDPDGREEVEFDPGEGAVKGPGPEWAESVAATEVLPDEEE